MDYLNIKRAYSLAQALRIYNRTSPFEITQQRFQILSAIHFMTESGHKTSKASIELFLKRSGIRIHWMNLTNQLYVLVENGLLSKEANDPQYRFNTRSTIAFNTIELLLRKHRVDKITV